MVTYPEVHDALALGGIDVVFCEDCGLIWNYHVRDDCPLCHWSGVVR
jgi:hypothetical protein